MDNLIRLVIPFGQHLTGITSTPIFLFRVHNLMRMKEININNKSSKNLYRTGILELS